jgi:hypothetical protein
VLPGPDGVFGKPTPQGGGRDLLDQAGDQQLLTQVGQAPAAGRRAAGRRQLAGDRLGLGDHRRWEPARPTRPWPVPQAGQALLAETPAPLAHRVAGDLQPLGDVRIAMARGRQQYDLGP